MSLRNVPELLVDKWDIEHGVVDSSDLPSPTETDALTGRHGDFDYSLNYLMDPFTQITDTKDALQKLVTVHIVKKRMNFSDDAFERKFIDFVEDRLRLRMSLMGVGAFIYGGYSLFFYNFFGKQDPLLSNWRTAANVMYNLCWMVVILTGIFVIIVAFRKSLFRHSVEQFLQITTLVVIISGMLFGNLWRVSRITRVPFYDAFPGMSDTYPDSDLVMLLGAIVLYLAVVVDMRFRRLVWICGIAFLLYAITVMVYGLPKFDTGSIPTSGDVANSGSRMQALLLTLQLFSIFCIGLFGKLQLELLQRRNFLELELASKRIDVLERTINAMDGDSQPQTQLEQTHKRLKEAQKSIEKVKLLGLSDSGGNLHLADELNKVLLVLEETEKTMTILDFQKEILLGPLKTGHEYEKDEVINWIASRENNSVEDFGGFGELGISAQSMMKRIGVEWNLDLNAMELSLNSNNASSGLSAFELTARALLTPFCQNVLLGLHTDIIAGFAAAAAQAYLEVPFHNAYRGAEVAHHAQIFMSAQLTGVRRHVSGIDNLALTVATLCHCISNFGRNNAFLVETRHDLATRYNDSAVLENFYATRTFEIIRASRNTNITALMQKRDQKRFRSRVIQLMLATDSSMHFHHLSELRLRVLGSPMFVDPDLIETDKRIGLVAVVKAAQLAFHAMPKDINVYWMERLAEEYAQQGDDEKALKLLVSPMSDRNTQSIGNIAAGITNLLVIPYYDEIENLIKKINPSIASENCLNEIKANILTNQTYWLNLSPTRRTHAPSFDAFIPMPRERTTISESPYTSAPNSPPSLVALDREISLSPSAAVWHAHYSDDDEEDEEPPILPFKQAHSL